MEALGTRNTMNDLEIRAAVIAMAGCLRELTTPAAMMAIAELMAASLLADSRNRTDFDVLPYAKRSLECMTTQIEILMNKMAEK